MSASYAFFIQTVTFKDWNTLQYVVLETLCKWCLLEMKRKTFFCLTDISLLSCFISFPYIMSHVIMGPMCYKCAILLSFHHLSLQSLSSSSSLQQLVARYLIQPSVCKRFCMLGFRVGDVLKMSKIVYWRLREGLPLWSTKTNVNEVILLQSTRGYWVHALLEVTDVHK